MYLCTCTQNDVLIFIVCEHLIFFLSSRLRLQQTAAAVMKDPLAQMLLQNGDRFGRQHVVYQSKRAYPAYLVSYRMVPDTTAATVPVVKVKSSMRCISVTVGDDCVYKGSPQASEHVFVLVAINITTLKAGNVALFNISNASGTESMMKFIAALEKDEIVAVAASNLSIPSKRSPDVVDVLRSLRSIGGSAHALDCPYVLVGAKHPCLLNGMAHEDHQSGKAAVAVDMRVIRHNRDTAAFNYEGVATEVEMAWFRCVGNAKASATRMPQVGRT